MQAALAPFQSLDRLLQVTAFAISMYNTIKRTQKPFKNLQQSTYELVYPEKGLRCIGEKVDTSPFSSAKGFAKRIREAVLYECHMQGVRFGSTERCHACSGCKVMQVRGCRTVRRACVNSASHSDIRQNTD